MASIQDVAREAGVSTATVSRALARKSHVSPDLRARVMAAAEKLSYRPNRVARSLRTQQSTTIGLIVSDIRNFYFTAVSRTIEDTAYEHRYSVFLCNTDESPEKESMYLDLMRDENVSGVIFSPTKQTSDNFVASSLGIPVVIIDRSVRDSEVDVVMIDNLESCYRLTTHLVENGHRRIAALFGEASTTGRERRKGFEKAMRDHELNPVAVRYIPPQIDAGYETTLALLKSSEPPEAMLTTNSMLTAGALRAIRELGLAIPDEVALAGFDETEWSTLVQPAITVIAQPTAEIGRTAVDLLLKRIQDPSAPYRQVILIGQLLARGSSAPRRAQTL